MKKAGNKSGKFRGIVVVLLLGILLCPQMVKAGEMDAVTSQEYVQTIHVSPGDISKYGFAAAFKRTLRNAKESGKLLNEKGIVKVEVPAGTYEIDSSMQINDSNLTIDFTGCTFIQKSGSNINLLRIGETNDPHTGYYYHDITIVGGVFDGSEHSNTLFKAAHAENIRLQGAVLRNVKNGHLIEVAGINGLSVIECSFENQILEKDSKALAYEAIQIDILTHNHLKGYLSEALATQNVLVEDCVFDHVPRGVGSHTSIVNCPVNGITIKNTTFRNIGSAAIQGQNWLNVDISDNQISGCPRGIALYALGNSGNYIPSDIAFEDGVATDLPDTYIKPDEEQKIKIYKNTIICQGKDPYASYDPVGIYVGGLKLTENTKSTNGSVISKGNYYMSGISIKNNTIQSLGNGMRLENVRKTIVTDNSMKFVGKKSSKEFHGIQLRLESQCTDIKNNKITGYNANGIYLNTKSYAQTISGNKISKVNKYGIGIENAKAGKIVKNTISSAKRYGVNVIEHAVVSSISGNKIGKCGEKIHVSKNSKAKSVKN